MSFLAHLRERTLRPPRCFWVGLARLPQRGRRRRLPCRSDGVVNRNRGRSRGVEPGVLVGEAGVDGALSDASAAVAVRGAALDLSAIASAAGSVLAPCAIVVAARGAALVLSVIVEAAGGTA